MDYLETLGKVLDILLKAFGLIKTVDTVLPKTKQSFSISKVLFYSSQLKQRLERKYPQTKFFIANDQSNFYQTIARELVETINNQSDLLSATSSPEKQWLKVGLVCGPMVHKTGEWIKKNSRLTSGKDFSNVRFVAMNRAAEADNFKYSANYLVTFFSEIFPKSSLRAYTSNSYDKKEIDDNRANVDILLCSAGPLSVGSIFHAEQSYISGWFGKLTNATFPQECIGDFCLTPINSKGKTVKLKQGLLESIDPYPQFKSLTDIKSTTIIFPVNTRRFARNEKKPLLTGKELVSKTILQSNIVDICILNSELGENLDKSIGNYVIKAVSNKRYYSTQNRACFAYLLQDNDEVTDSEHNKSDNILRTIVAYDPVNRLDDLDCSTDSEPSIHADEIPQIIFSEIVDEAQKYDWKQDTGEFKYTIDTNDFSFYVDKGVRRPGQWGLVTAQLTKYYIDMFVRKNKKAPLNVWDMGCGCGVIGIVAGVTSNHKIDKLLFTDISSRAVSCTERNLRQHPSIAAQVKVGDLFDSSNIENEKFSVIAFNPPFLPMYHIEKALSADSGGDSGKDVAERYCESVIQYLELGGWSILAMPDYVDDGQIKGLLEQKFGQENVYMKERIILYPEHPFPPIPTAYEIRYKAEIENNLKYRFETCVFGKDKFLAFKMRHYIANRVK